MHPIIAGPSAPGRHDPVADTSEHDPFVHGWDRLDARSGWSMGYSPWLQAWIEATPPGQAIRLVAVGPAETPTAIAPFAAAGRRLVGITGEEPADVTLAEPGAADALARALLALRRPFLLPRLPAESPLVPALQRVFRGRGVIVVRPAVGTPTLPLDGVDPAAPEQVLSSRRRSDLRRARRRAEQMGEVATEVHAPRDPAEAGRLLEEAIKVEAASWKWHAGTALASDTPEARAEARALRRFVALAAPRGSLRLAFLRLDGEPAAMQIAVEKCGHYGLLKIGYDERFKRCSPGQLLMLEAIRHGAAASLASIELLGAVEPWTRAWTRMERLCVSVRAYPAGVAGLTTLGADLLRTGARKTRRMAGRRR